MTENNNVVLQAISELQTELKNEISSVRSELKDEISSVRSELKDEISELRGELNGVKLTIENEIRPNINIIAEGHTELNRKLDEVLKIESEKELLLVRVNVLESDVRDIKNQLIHSA